MFKLFKGKKSKASKDNHEDEIRQLKQQMEQMNLIIQQTQKETPLVFEDTKKKFLEYFYKDDVITAAKLVE